jgi:hypothetical protein
MTSTVKLCDIETWMLRLKFSTENITDVEATSENMLDLVEAQDNDFDGLFLYWKTLTRKRFLNELAKVQREYERDATVVTLIDVDANTEDSIIVFDLNKPKFTTAAPDSALLAMSRAQEINEQVDHQRRLLAAVTEGSDYQQYERNIAYTFIEIQKVEIAKLKTENHEMETLIGQNDETIYNLNSENHEMETLIGQKNETIDNLNSHIDGLHMIALAIENLAPEAKRAREA